MKTGLFAAALMAVGLHCSEAAALSLEIPVDKLLDGSSAVVTVRVTSGQTIDNSGYSCGSEYKGEIIDSIKGEGQKIISFGSKIGLEIGKEYVIVLAGKAEYVEDEIWLASNEGLVSSDVLDRRVVQIKACGSVLPSEMIAAFGLASFLIERPLEMGGMTRAVKVPLLIMWLPPGTQCTKAPSLASNDQSRWAVWVRPEELLRVFKASIRRPPGTRTVGGPGKQPIGPRDCGGSENGPGP